ncbi:hypothetical protein [Butyrivibrio sp. FC2001]|uniref:hypothetical protein n=1 Tax=Butyrivibrio sp. FC2001 TaxID=1280671 RepID=UPI0003FF1046|nr:hypothetical protein [Butyrivibrio sp. FC2001]
MKKTQIQRRGILLSMALLAGISTITPAYSLNAKAYVQTTANQDETYTITNTDTNDSCISKNKEDHLSNAYINSDITAKTITTKSYDELNNIDLYTTYDVAKYGNFRTDKGELKVKVIEKKESNYEKSKIYVNGTDGKKYCKNVFGNKQEYSDAVVAEAEKTNKYHAYGEYCIRFYTKKPGKYKFSYDALDSNGNVIITKTIKVIAKEDGDPIKEASFAGKRFYVSGNSRLNGATEDLYSSVKDGNYTKKKSGKLQITMNKGFKLRKIEVGHVPVAYKETSTVDDWAIVSKAIEWSEVNNGKKIRLNTIDAGGSSYDKDKKKAAPEGYRIRTSERMKQYATTYIRVTYYDKKNKTTERETFKINKLINK